MSLLSDNIAKSIGSGSWIRRMFEAGAQLKAEYGADKVYDFSLGNPDLAAPATVRQGLENLLKKADQPFTFGYTPNAGLPEIREKLAKHLAKEQNAALTKDDLLLTCGAAGAFNVFLRAIINPGEEALTFAPYFVEYASYCSNHQANFKALPTNPTNFMPDLEALEKAITSKTRVLIYNSPNNPTGVIYDQQTLEAIIAILDKKGQEYGKPIWLLADEPYRFLAYDGAVVPSPLNYPYAVIVSSFSKNLSLAGERVGYLALSPKLEQRAEVMAGLILANRILGFVNAPIVGMQILASALGSQVDLSTYAARRTKMAEILLEAGYEFQMPAGAFYFFPKAPGGDDLAFVNGPLLKERILAVPGTGFGCPGYFRLAFCVDLKVIAGAKQGFINARKS